MTDSALMCVESQIFVQDVLKLELELEADEVTSVVIGVAFIFRRRIDPSIAHRKQASLH